MSEKSNKHPRALSGTALIHADDVISPEVAPSISVTTSEHAHFPHLSSRPHKLPAYRHPVPGADIVPELELDSQNPQRHVYSRYTQDISGRVEKILSAINVRPLSLYLPR
jgi:cystathionine gamma-synthase